MATWLRVSTAVEVAIGPFLDSVDGSSIENGLTITQPDIRLKKNGGAWAQKNAAQTLTHEENGWYEISLDATDTNTLGILIVVVHEAGALPVWREFLVVTANVYDTFFSTDLLQVDLTQLLGSAIATPTVAGVLEADITHWLGSAAATPTVAGVPEVDLTHYLGAATPALVSGRFSANVGSMSANVVTSTAIAADAITSTKVADGFMTAAKLAANAITSTATASDFLGEINAEVDTAIADARLDELLLNDSDIDGAQPPALGSVIHELMSKSTGSFTYDQTTDSLEALRDKETDIETDTQDIQARLPAALVAGRIKALIEAVAANAIDDAGVAADMDAYSAKVWVVRESTTADHYAVVFFKNGQPVTSGITGPTIQVIKASDGTDLIASGALAEVGSLGIYKKDETTGKLTGGAIYFAKVTATIDGSTRSWLQQLGRDSA